MRLCRTSQWFSDGLLDLFGTPHHELLYSMKVKGPIHTCPFCSKINFRKKSHSFQCVCFTSEVLNYMGPFTPRCHLWTCMLWLQTSQLAVASLCAVTNFRNAPHECFHRETQRVGIPEPSQALFICSHLDEWLHVNSGGGSH